MKNTAPRTHRGFTGLSYSDSNKLLESESALSKAARNIAIGGLSIALAFAALPWLQLARYGIHLESMPVPATLALPIADLKRGKMIDTWHAARAQHRHHEGIDLFASKGTPIVATTEGFVLWRGQDKLGGNVVWVFGPGGQQHYYAHLDQFADVHTGDRVHAGMLLGYVGNTGNASTTPPHLHYGVYGDAGAINPYPLLAMTPG